MRSSTVGIQASNGIGPCSPGTRRTTRVHAAAGDGTAAAGAVALPGAMMNGGSAAALMLKPAAELQRSMMDEMDRRRQDWEKEVERMQEDFFQVKLVKPNNNNNNAKQLCLPSSSSSPPNDVKANDVTTNDVSRQPPRHSVHPEVPEYYTETVDGIERVMCRWIVDMSDYKPEELSVRVEHGKLIVAAKHVDPTNNNSRQYSKHLDIPRDVRHNQMTSFLTRDGRLNILAPVQRDQSRPLGDVTLSNDVTARRPVTSEANGPIGDRYFRPIEPAALALVDDVSPSSCPHIVKTDDGQEMLQLVIDIGRSDYSPEDITVTLSTNGRKISIEANHEETAGGLRSVTRQFQRDIDVRVPLFAPSLRAMLDNNGKLWLAASTARNNDHRTVNAIILQFMPRFASKCIVLMALD